MTGSEHDKLIDELSAYLDGELDAQARAAVEALLADSEPARRLLADLRAVAGGLRGLPRAAAPASLAENVIRGIRSLRVAEAQAPVAPRRHGSERPWRALRLATGLLATAAAFVMIAVGVRFVLLPPVHAPPTGGLEQAAPPRSGGDASRRELAPPPGEPGQARFAGAPRSGVAPDDESATRARTAERLQSEVTEAVAAPASPALAARGEPEGADAAVRASGLRANEPVEELTQSVAAGRTVVHVVVRARSEDEYNASVAAVAAATTEDEKTVHRRLDRGGGGDRPGGAPPSPTPLVGKALEPVAGAFQRTLQVNPPEAWELLAALERVSAGEISLSVETAGFAADEKLNLGVAAMPAERVAPADSADAKPTAARSGGGRGGLVGGGAVVAPVGEDKEAPKRPAPTGGMRGGGGGAPGAVPRRAAGADVAGAGETAATPSGVRDRESAGQSAEDESQALLDADGPAGLPEALRRIWPDWSSALDDARRAAEYWLSELAPAEDAAGRAAAHEWVLHITVLPPAEGERPAPASQPGPRP